METYVRYSAIIWRDVHELPPKEDCDCFIATDDDRIYEGYYTKNFTDPELLIPGIYDAHTGNEIDPGELYGKPCFFYTVSSCTSTNIHVVTNAAYWADNIIPPPGKVDIK